MKDNMTKLPDDANGDFTALRTAFIGLMNSLFETNTKVDKLAERISDLQISQRQTDERLNAMILMAEKFFSGENGDPKKN